MLEARQMHAQHPFLLPLVYEQTIVFYFLVVMEWFQQMLPMMDIYHLRDNIPSNSHYRLLSN